jgi:hypothetical protein
MLEGTSMTACVSVLETMSAEFWAYDRGAAEGWVGRLLMAAPHKRIEGRQKPSCGSGGRKRCHFLQGTGSYEVPQFRVNYQVNSAKFHEMRLNSRRW